ncbi:MAG: prepilin peptidase [Candidatus Diapherotrites archaeon]|nr:prepilin peptidase [Candidatus Diapherotrites archaeon]
MASETLLLRQGIVVLAAVLSAYTDIKTGYIYNAITYPLIALGIVLNLFEQNWLGIALGIGALAAGYVLYLTGNVGGGDVKLFTGIALTLPFQNNQPFIMTSLVLAGATALLVLGTAYPFRYWKAGGGWKEIKESIPKTVLLGLVFIAYLYFTWSWHVIRTEALIGLGIVLASGLAFTACEEGIRKRLFQTNVQLDKLEEDEVIAWNALPKELQNESIWEGKRVIGKKQIGALKERNIHTVPVYRNLPKFGVFMLVGVAVNLAFPGWMEWAWMQGI